jgi:phosphopantetheinyl transferase (holo-ACP synthase)
MPIGTDIEYKKVRSPELFDYIADFDEQRLLKRLGKEGLLACWTAKEAAQKADSKLFDIRQYKITSTNASKLTFTISRAGKRWSGKWIITEEFVCTLAIQA